ncbi:uncharacterized protein LOC132793057 [Drosophila nasuta]|uniref:uncharacterized protein LOC132793057 n=1 Tax=Drosophila nasuta TaxID=42062 RepID=UPI00295E7710|nr:uncharacterized protein LOC132793057 [Drosophila nasuta]
MPHRRIIYRQEDKSSITYFPTGSKFCGSQNALGMQDYGMYVWPDGSRYVGVFCDNKFHGDGYIELSPPHNICYKVLHEHGKLKKDLQHGIHRLLASGFHVARRCDEFR